MKTNFTPTVKQKIFSVLYSSTQQYVLSFVFFVLIGLINLNLLAQTDAQRQQIKSKTNVAALEQMAIDFGNYAAQRKMLAEQWANTNNIPILSETPDGHILVLVDYDSISGLQYITVNNLTSSKTISTDKILPSGSSGLNLTGSGIIISVWDDGKVCDQHPELIGRAFSGPHEPLGGSISQHSTHVAGTLISFGVNPNSRGMAPSSILNYYNLSNWLNEIPLEAADGTLLSNNSWGGLNSGWAHVGVPWYWMSNPAYSEYEYFGLYVDMTKMIDQIANNAPYHLFIKSAGNDRGYGPPTGTEHYHLISGVFVPGFTDFHEKHGGSGGFDCMDRYSCAKNVLTVGATFDLPNGYTSPSSVALASFSNTGPTDDGRIKPDVVANGVGLYSTYNTPPSGCATLGYNALSGTSMSAPSVTGSAALLQEHYSNTHGGSFMLASTLKALIIETTNEAGANNGPDYHHGWGLMNTNKAAETITKDLSNPSTIQELTLVNGQTIDIPFTIPNSNNCFLSATIVWNDPAGTPPPVGLDPTNLMLVNDLDLRIIDPLSGINFPWTLDPLNPANAAIQTADNFRDNVEQVRIYNAIPGSYIVRITHKGTLLNPQDFSIIITSSQNIDLYTKDSPNDFGIEPNITTTYPWLSEDIWVRNQADGLTNQTHQNPEHSSTNNPAQLNYVYVRVRNKGCVASDGTTETLDLHWAKASTSLNYPANWNGSLDLLDGNLSTLPNAIAGNLISSQTIPAIPAGGEVILEFTWNPPSPNDYSFNSEPGHFCLLSKIVSTADPITPFTAIGSYVTENNNVAWKNLTVVDNVPGIIVDGDCPQDMMQNIGVAVVVANPDNIAGTFDIKFSVPQEELSSPITTEGKITIALDEQLYEKWKQGGKKGTGITEIKSPPMSENGANNNNINDNAPITVSNRKMFEITGTSSSFDNITLAPNEVRTTSLMVTYPANPVSEKNTFNYDIVQKRSETGELIGGVRYAIQKPNCGNLIVDAGSNQTIKRGCSAALVAFSSSPLQLQLGKDCSSYQWFDDSGKLIAEQSAVKITPNTTTTYTLKFTSTSGCVSEDQVTITVLNQLCKKEKEIIKITPNPANDFITIDYKALNTNNAHIRLLKTDNSIDRTYPLDLQNTQKTINVADCNFGSYVMMLVCDGVNEDSEIVIIQ